MYPCRQALSGATPPVHCLLLRACGARRWLSHTSVPVALVSNSLSGSNQRGHEPDRRRSPATNQASNSQRGHCPLLRLMAFPFCPVLVSGAEPQLQALRNRQKTLKGLVSATEAAHSITSLTRTINDSGILRPNALAVVKLTARSNFTGCSTGRSPGFEPCRILSTKSPARRNRSAKFGP